MSKTYPLITYQTKKKKKTNPDYISLSVNNKKLYFKKEKGMTSDIHKLNVIFLGSN